MEENKQEKLSIIRFFFVALLIDIALFLTSIVLGIDFNSTMVMCVFTFEIFLINTIYSNHIIRAIDNKVVAAKKEPEILKEIIKDGHTYLLKK